MFKVKYNYNFVKFEHVSTLGRNFLLLGILKKFLFAFFATVVYESPET